MSSIRPSSAFRHPNLVRTDSSRELRGAFERRAPETARNPPAQEPSWRDGFEDLSSYKPKGLGSLDGTSKPSAPSYSPKLNLKPFDGGSVKLKPEGAELKYEQKAGSSTLSAKYDTATGKPAVTLGTKLGGGEASVTAGPNGLEKVEAQIPVGLVFGVPVSARLEATPDSFGAQAVAGVETPVVTTEAALGGVYTLGDGLDVTAEGKVGFTPAESLSGTAQVTGNLDTDEGVLTLGASFDGRLGSLQVSPQGELKLRLWGEPDLVAGGAFPPGFVPEAPAPTGLPTTVGPLTVGGAPLSVPEDYGTGPTGLVPGGAFHDVFVDFGAGPRPEALTPAPSGMVLGGALGPSLFGGSPVPRLEELSPVPSPVELLVVPEGPLRTGGAMPSGAELALGFDDGSVANPYTFEDTQLRTGGAWEELLAEPTPVSPEPVSVPQENSSFLSSVGSFFGLGGGATGSW